MGINAELLSSPSGALLIGSSEEVSRAKTVVQTIVDQKKEIGPSEDTRNVSTFVKKVAGWSNESSSSYLETI